MSEKNSVNFNYDSIKYFISVARHGSLSRAAFSLGISQSALSQSMKNLEDSLGVTLFNRNTRGIILTQEGKTLYEKATIGNDYFEEAIIETLRMNQFGKDRTFKIDASGTLFHMFIAPNFKKIIEKYPDVYFKITSSVNQNNCVEKLQNGDADLIIIKSNENFAVKEITTKKLETLTYCLAYDPKYFNFDASISFEEIKKYPIMMKQRTGRFDNSWIRATFSKIIICERDRDILELIRNGVGIGIYPKELAKKEKIEILEFSEFPPVLRFVECGYLEANTIADDIVKIITDSMS